MDKVFVVARSGSGVYKVWNSEVVVALAVLMKINICMPAFPINIFSSHLVQ